MRRLLSYQLEKQYTVFESEDGESCIKKLSSEKIHAILLDINMPKKNGLEVLEEIGKNFPHIPVIMLTSVHNIDTAVHAIKLGAYDYITKPAWHP